MFAAITNVYLVCYAGSKNDIQVIENSLSQIVPNIVPRARLLFHKSTIGKIAIARQLKPKIYLDADTTSCDSLCKHLSSVYLLTRRTSLTQQLSALAKTEKP